MCFFWSIHYAKTLSYHLQVAQESDWTHLATGKATKLVELKLESTDLIVTIDALKMDWYVPAAWSSY